MASLLPLELDFAHEAANAERCRAFFSRGGGGAHLAGEESAESEESAEKE